MLSINKIKDNHNKNIKYEYVSNLLKVDIDLSFIKKDKKKFDGFIYEINHHFLSFYLSLDEKERKIINKKLFNKDKINNLSIIYDKSPYSLFDPIYYTDKYLRDFSIDCENDLFLFLNKLNKNYRYNLFLKNYNVRNEYKNINTSNGGYLLFDFYKKHSLEEIYFINEIKETGLPLSTLIYSDSSGEISGREYYKSTIKEEKEVISLIKEKYNDLTYYIEVKSIDKIDESFIDNIHYNLIDGIYYYFKDDNNYFSLNEMNYSYKDKNIIVNYLVVDNRNIIDHFSSLFNLLNNKITNIYFPLIVKDYNQIIKYNENISSLFIYKDINIINNNLLSIIDIYNDCLIQGNYLLNRNSDIPYIGIINDDELVIIINKRNIKKDISIKYDDKCILLNSTLSDYLFLKFNININ